MIKAILLIINSNDYSGISFVNKKDLNFGIIKLVI